jgi:hypothetical protein
MAGILLASGQTWVIDQMASGIATLGGLYIGLMENSSTPSEGNQIGTGITELSPGPAGSGYTRRFSATPWGTTVGVDPTISGTLVTFNVSGTWADVNGYFVSKTASGNDALWAEVFSVDKQGTKYAGDSISVIPIYEQKYDGES